MRWNENAVLKDLVLVVSQLAYAASVDVQDREVKDTLSSVDSGALSNVV